MITWWNKTCKSCLYVLMFSFAILKRQSSISIQNKELWIWMSVDTGKLSVCMCGQWKPRSAFAVLLWNHGITKTRLHNFDPLKPHFYIVKLGFIGVYIIFIILLKNIVCGYLLEPPRRGGSNEYPQSMFWAETWKKKKKKKSEFLPENFQYFGGEISINLNRRVFVMDSI